MSSADDRSDAPEDRRAERSRLFAHQAAELERRRARETAQARELVAAFVAEARERRVPAVPLRARSRRGGGATVRTDVVGWYVRRDRSVGVGTDGELYLLTVDVGLRERLSGARLRPSDPPLVLGAGGRDGDSVDLADALRRTLDEGAPR